MRARALASLLPLVAACAVGPDWRRPEAPKAEGYGARESRATVEADGEAQRFALGADLPADWWRLFGSRAVDDEVRAALARNATLEAARASLARSKELLKAGYGVFFPQVDGQLGVSRSRVTPIKTGSTLPASELSLFTVGATVSYALDVWGGERRQVEALGAQVDAQAAALHATRILLTGNVIDALVARAAASAQAEATRATVALQREQLAISAAQAKGGTAPYANVLSLKAQIAATEALVPALEQRVDAADHLLATLEGRTPAESGGERATLLDLRLPADVPVSLPSKLVAQRPDILVAEAQLHAANAQIGVATAAMLPNITLTANAGANNGSIGSLFNADGVFWGVGAGLVQPIFHGGALWHQRKAAILARDAAAASYRATVLAAFQQVADALTALEHDAEGLKAYREASDAATEALVLVQANYRAGTANYLQVIVASEQSVSAQNAYLQAVAERLEDTVALYVALGGGWWNDPEARARR